MGLLERQHRSSIKDSLKAAIVDMGDQYQNKWMDFLPFMMLGKNSTLQVNIGSSASELTFGTKVRLPGQILHDPGEIPDESQLRNLLEDVRNKTDIQAHQTSRHNPPEKPLKQIPDDVTHVFTRQHHTTGLDAPYKGPFLVESRPSRSTVRIEVGQYSGGRKRHEVRHFNDLKLAHEDSPAAAVHRPKLGRPSSKVSVPGESSRSTEEKTPSLSSGANRFSATETPPGNLAENNSAVAEGKQPAKIQTPLRQSTRSTRNLAPKYVDAIGVYSGPGMIDGIQCQWPPAIQRLSSKQNVVSISGRPRGHKQVYQWSWWASIIGRGPKF